MDLLSTLSRYQKGFLDQYDRRLSTEQKQALNAMLYCRTERYGKILLRCPPCGIPSGVFHSCGHRSCYRCQHHDTQKWLERQQRKLIPVSYYMVTFTVPFELRDLIRNNQRTAYRLLFESAVNTLKDFASNDKKLGHDLGLTAVLHTHSRKLDFHPHIHVVVPGGCVDKKRKEWKTLQGKYLFNEFNLAKVFRGKLLAALKEAGLSPPNKLPKQWVTDCESVGKGLPALTYLSRYLYKGVFSEKNLVDDDGTHVTFKYKDSRSGDYQTRRLKGEDFLWLILQHTLPRGFRRVRDYGFLHGNAKYLLKVIQLALGVIAPPLKIIKRAAFKCPCCKGPMRIVAFIRPAWRSG